MPEGTELFHIMRTTRAMRRLKPDPVPDELINQICKPASGRPTAAPTSAGGSW